MEADLIALLLARPAVTGAAGDRITPLARKQGAALPAIVMQRIGGGPEYADDGEAGIQGARMQIDCWGETYASAKDLSGLVISELSALADVIEGATTFLYIVLEEVRDLRESGVNQAEYLYRTSLDFLVWTTH